MSQEKMDARKHQMQQNTQEPEPMTLQSGNQDAPTGNLQTTKTLQRKQQNKSEKGLTSINKIIIIKEE